MRGMGVRIWGTGLVAAAVIAAVTASGAPVVQAAEAPLKLSYDLPASLADKTVAETPHADFPDRLVQRWACDRRISIYYAAAPGIDSRSVLRELEYPVEYLRALGYDVSIMREVAYRADYQPPTKPGDVLLVVPLTKADATVLRKNDWWAMTEPMSVGNVIQSAKITVDGDGGLSSDTLLHELGHVLGLEHKAGTVMNERIGAALAFDPAETAAVDCR